jgi:hypothetical protein
MIGSQLPDTARDFSSSALSDRLCGPPSLPYNGNGESLLKAKVVQSVKLTIHLHLVRRSNFTDFSLHTPYYRGAWAQRRLHLYLLRETDLALRKIYDRRTVGSIILSLSARHVFCEWRSIVSNGSTTAGDRGIEVGDAVGVMAVLVTLLVIVLIMPLLVVIENK